MARRKTKEKVPARLAYLDSLASQYGWEDVEEDELDSAFRLSRFPTTLNEEGEQVPVVPVDDGQEEQTTSYLPSLSDIVLSTTSALPGPMGTLAMGVQGAMSDPVEVAYYTGAAGWREREASQLS